MPNAAFEFSCGSVTVKGEIPQVVERGVDNVVTGTGDMIYIEQRLDYVEEYLSWYISNGVGNLLTIRPTYRCWCGTHAQPRRVEAGRARTLMRWTYTMC